MLFQAHMPSSYWVEALQMAADLFNILPFPSINNEIPFSRFFLKPISYDHLGIFGCLCYPNLIPTSQHKLAARSSKCIVLGYPSNHSGYRCLNLQNHRIILSRHVTFDESSFPFKPSAESDQPTPTSSISSDTNIHAMQSLQLADTQHSSSSLHFTAPTSSHVSSPPPAVTSQHQPTFPPILEVALEPNTTPIIPASTVPVPQANPPGSQSGITKKKHIFSLHTDVLSPLPLSHIQAAKDPN